jgi:hypothetical protein
MLRGNNRNLIIIIIIIITFHSKHVTYMRNNFNLRMFLQFQNNACDRGLDIISAQCKREDATSCCPYLSGTIRQ